MLRTIHAAAEEIRRGCLSPVQLLEECLARIDHLETRVKAWVFVAREQALEDARHSEAELRRGEYRGPLHGIPIGVKDIYDVFDWPTAAGSRLWAQSFARHDAAVVERLRHAGAIFVGKTVTTQWASFDPSPTNNPWDVARTPGGSSSGSAAALACGMCLGALASQTGGSITRPASYCGVAGCKPTYGRVSTAGVVPLAPSMDHPGPMALCVRDLALLLQVMAGPDPRDPACVERPVPAYVTGLDGPLPAPRLGCVRGLFEERAEPVMRAFIKQTEEKLAQRGANLHQLALPSSFAEVVPRHRVIMAVEAAAYHKPRLRRHPDDYLPNIRALLEEGLACPAPDYGRCKEHQRRLSQEMLAYFRDVDALLTPATVGPPPGRETTGDPAFNSPWSYTGLPTISIPAGWTSDGLPLAIQLIGPPWSERELFRTAAWCERNLDFERKEPCLPTRLEKP